MAPEKRQITRNRTSYSCQTCRRRKVKCDKKHPVCGTCAKNDEECIYATDNDETGQKQDTAPESRKRKVESNTTGALEEGARKSKATATTTAAANDSFIDSLQGIQALLDQATELADRAGLLGTDSLLADRFHIAADTSESLQSISEKLKSLNLLFQDGVDNDSGPSRNGSAGIVAGPSSSHTQSHAVIESATTRSHLKLPPQVPWENDFSVKALPDAHSNVLFRCWLLSAYSILPIVDPYEALEKYEAFHFWYRRNYDKGIPNPVEAYMPLIIAIQYGGLLGMSTRGVRKWWPEVPRRVLLCNMRLHFWRTIDTVKPSVNTVAAEVMMRYMCHERYNIANSSAQLAILIRNAQGLGLHRSGTHLVETPSYQRLHRLWWEVINLDTLLACSCLIPPLLESIYYEDKLPSELKDFKHGSEEAFTYEVALQAKTIKPQAADFPFDDTRPSIVSMHGIVSKARALWTKSMRKMIAILTGVEVIQQKHITEMSRMLHEISMDIKAIISRLPTNDTPELAEPQIPSTSGQSVALDAAAILGEPITKTEIDYHLGKAVTFHENQMAFVHQIEVGANAFHKWARVALSTMLDQIACFAFSPFLKDPKSKLWSIVRSCALRSCQRFFRGYINLATNLELESFRWTWIGMFQPVHASKIMLVDLYERPFSEEAARSRTLFDQMLLLNYPEYGIVGGSHGLTLIGSLEDETQESWTLLNHLRAKAWQRAELDPMFLWNEQDQIRRLQQNSNNDLQGSQRRAGKVRQDQPLLMQKLVDEKEWRYEPGSFAAPFKGLNELIQKIRGSKHTPVSTGRNQATNEQDTPGTNFFGDTWLNQAQNDQMQDHTRIHEEPNHTTSLRRRKDVDDRVRERTTTGMNNNTTSQHAYSPSNAGISTAQSRCFENNTVNGTDSFGDSLLSVSTVQRPLADGQAQGWPELGHIYPLPLMPVHVDQGLHTDPSLDFDWSHWDTVYGGPGDHDMQGLASTDADMIAAALGYT